MKRFKNVLLGALLAMVATGPAFAGAMADYLENRLVDHVFRGTAYTAPTSVYIGLSTVACNDASFGTEVTGGSYARVAVAGGAASWNGTHGNTTGASSGTSGTISNAAAITFPAPTASWGQVVSFFGADATSGGNLLFCANLTTPKTINNGDAAPSFAAGALTFQIDN